MIFLQLEDDGLTIKKFPIDEPLLRSMYPSTSFPTNYFLNNGVLPEGIVEVKYENGDRITANLDNILIDSLPTLVAGVWVLPEGERAQAYRLEAEKTLKLAQLCRNVDALIRHYAQAQNIPDAEIQTWIIQNQEAFAWNVDNNIATPFLDIIASARGIDREELIARTLTKAQTYLGLLGTVIGKRQAIEDLIVQAETIAELDAISLQIVLTTNN